MGFLFPVQQSEAQSAKPAVFQMLDADSTLSAHEAFFNRAVDQELLSIVYLELFGLETYMSVQWFQVFTDDTWSAIPDNSLLMLENHRSGGFELSDEVGNFISFAKDYDDRLTMETSNGVWVRAGTQGIWSVKYTTNKGHQYIMQTKPSLNERLEIKAEDGYKLKYSRKLSGNVVISDNEGRKVTIIKEKSGIFRVMEGKEEKKTFIVHSRQSFALENGTGETLNIRLRGRYNDVEISNSKGQELFIENHFRKPLAPLKVEEVKK